MDTKTQDTIKHILDVISYTDDKDAFVKDFIQGCHIKAVSKLTAGLPDDQKGNVEKMMQTEEYKTAFGEAVSKSLVEFLDTIAPTLTPDQGQQLESYLHGLRAQAA